MDRLDRRWSCVVLVAVYTGIIILSASAYMAGVLLLALLEKYNGSKGRISIIGALNSGLLCLLGPLASMVMNRYSCRVSMFTGGCLLFLGPLVSAFMPNPDLLILTYGVVGGVGNALAATSFVVVLGYYFHSNRNLVISMSTAVIGVGMIVAAPVGLAIIETYGLNGTFLIISCFNVQLCVIAVICKPSTLELKLKDDRRKHSLKQNMAAGKRESWRVCVNSLFGGESDVAIYKNISLILFMLSTVTWNMMLSICLMHLPTYMSIKGATNGQISAIMICFSVSNTLGRFLAGLTVDRCCLDSMVLHVIMLGVAGIVTVTFPLYGHLTGGDYVFSAIIGLFTGGPNSLMTPITLGMVDVDMLSVAHGLEYFFSGIGFVLATPIAGYLFDSTGSYNHSFYFAGAVILLGSFLGILSSLGIRRDVTHETLVAPPGPESASLFVNETEVSVST